MIQVITPIHSKSGEQIPINKPPLRVKAGQVMKDDCKHQRQRDCTGNLAVVFEPALTRLEATVTQAPYNEVSLCDKAQC
jgi:hypothetical protein